MAEVAAVRRGLARAVNGGAVDGETARALRGGDFLGP